MGAFWGADSTLYLAPGGVYMEVDAHVKVHQNSHFTLVHYMGKLHVNFLSLHVKINRARRTLLSRRIYHSDHAALDPTISQKC